MYCIFAVHRAPWLCHLRRRAIVKNRPHASLSRPRMTRMAAMIARIPKLVAIVAKAPVILVPMILHPV